MSMVLVKLEREYEELKWNLFGKEITIGVNTDEDNQRVYDLIEAAVGIMENDAYIYNII